MIGVRRVVAYNWPQYAAAAAVIVVAAVVASQAVGWVRVCAIVAAATAGWFASASLVATWCAYDASDLAAGAWLRRALVSPPQRLVVVHAGLDLASAAVAAAFPMSARLVRDIYDRDAMPERSIARARGAAAGSGPAIDGRLPIGDDGAEAVVAVLALHELRSRERIAAFARDAARVVTPGGRLIVVEHLRDLANTLAYGPGVRHFLPLAVWRAAFADAGWAIDDRWRIGGWLTAFVLRRG